MSKAPTRPLQVTATLADGRIVSTDGIVMFDSIIYHAWFYKYAPQVLRGECAGERLDGYIGLPFARLPNNRWMASKGVYDEVERHVEYYNKRPDFFAADKLRWLKDDKGIIDDSAGKYRAYRNPVIVRVLKDAKITFFCRGNKNEIVDLLSRIPAVGKKPAMGWEIVQKWEVKEIEEDFSTFHPKYGLMRPIPVEDSAQYSDVDLSKYPIFQYGIKPPYWKQVNARPCYVPVVT